MNISVCEWKFGSISFRCDRPVVMGILNVTPDSFSDGGQFFDFKAAVKRAHELVSEGADIVDIGGESSRPGSDAVGIDEEIKRTIPVIAELKESGFSTPISIDTRRMEVAEKALDNGAVIVNDISALRDCPDIADLSAERNAGLVLMHMLGTPKTMQVNPSYINVVDEISDFLNERISFAISRNVPVDSIVIDPGIGFGKTLAHNLEILSRLDEFSKIGRPVLLGPSRKRFIGDITGESVERRIPGTIAACVTALERGARIFRVHDVGKVKQALDVAWSIINVKREGA